MSLYSYIIFMFNFYNELQLLIGNIKEKYITEGTRRWLILERILNVRL